jgi:hypothetical protein
MRPHACWFFLLVPISVATADGPSYTHARERRIVEQITSIFENSTPYFQYGYAEKLLDYRTRGITFGRIGFTSCQDGLEVLRRFDELRPRNTLSRFREIMAETRQGTRSCESNVGALTSESPNFFRAVARLGRDPDFRQAQDEIAEFRYFAPSDRLAGGLGLRLAWSFLVVYDTFVQHGEGLGEGIDEVVARTRAAWGGKTPASPEVSEGDWILTFLEKRREILEEGDDEWKKSVARVDALREIHTRDANDDLHPYPFRSRVYGNWQLPASGDVATGSSWPTTPRIR